MKRLLLMLAAGAALWTAACGGNGIATPPPPVGKYKLGNLRGQYAFVTTGESFVAGSLTATPLARTGVFNADGMGNITGGVEDVNADGTTSLALQISGGNYTVNADGRGTLTLNITSNAGTSSINFGTVLTSSSDGLLIDETSNNNQASTGSGNFVLQTGGPFTLGSVTGPYIFDFSGLDGNQTSLCPCPESFVGRFDVNNAGTITSGFFDDNDNGTFGSGAVVGNFAPDPVNPSFPISTFGRGIAQIASQNYVFYIVDSTRVRLISTNGGMLSGDAVAQSNIPPANPIASSFVFIVAGSSGNGGITRVGRFTANGAAVTNVLVDTNNSGQFIQTNTTNNASMTLDAANPGRGTVTFTDPHFASAPFKFVFYLSSPTQGVLQETTTNNGTAVVVADGTIAAQTGSPFTSGNISGTYALNWSGLSLQNGGSFSVHDEEDLLSQVVVSNLSLSGAADIFQFQNGVPVFDLVTSGTIAISGDGTSSSTPSPSRNTMSVKLVKSNSTTVNFVVYFVNPHLAFIANNQDSHRTVAGILKAQQ